MPLSTAEEKDLTAALNYCTMEELAEISAQLKLPATGKKGEIVARIFRYATTQVVEKSKKLPEASLAKKGRKYSLHKKTLILKGSYSNNMATRRFMMSLVGDHFRFSAAGQDWIAKRWQQGNPPTYQEFAQFWQADNERRKKVKAEPKDEWAYLNFIQNYSVKNPEASQETMTKAWHELRQKMVARAHELLKKSLS